MVQPPKKDAKPKADATDGAPTGEMSKDQLEKLVASVTAERDTDRAELNSIRKELEQEMKERNYFQLERNKLQNFWNITKAQLEEKKAELRNKDRELEEAEERHQSTISEYNQKVRYLLHEHQVKATQLKTDEVVATKLMQQQQADAENDLWKRLHSMAAALKEQQVSNDLQIKLLKLKHDEEVTEISNNFEKQVQELIKKNQAILEILYEEQDLRHRNEVHEMQLKKNESFVTLTRNHDNAIKDLHNHYENINLKNDALIVSLQEQLEEMKKKDEIREKEIVTLQQQNQVLTVQEHKSTEEVERLQKQLRNYKTDKALLAKTKARVMVVDQEINVLKMEKEVLEHKLNKVQEKYDHLYAKFGQAILEVQKKCGVKSLLLQKQLDVLTDTQEQREISPASPVLPPI